VSVTHEQMQKAEQQVLDTFERLGFDRVHPLMSGLYIEWGPRHTKSLGDALFLDMSEEQSPGVKASIGIRYPRAHLYLARVRFSVPLWPRATEEERHETVVHEVCHIVAQYRNGRIRIKSHGEEWQATMREAGVEPRTTHTVDRTGLRRRQKRYPAHCDCRVHEITAQKVRKIRGGSVYRCKICKGRLAI